MPTPYDYTVAQPNFGSYIDAMRQGRTDRLAVEQDQRNNALAKYLPGALQGDAAAQQQALASGSPDQMIQLKQIFQGMDAQKLGKVKEIRAASAAGAMWAKTPEQWAIVQDRIRADAQAAGVPFAEVPFEQKDAMVAMGQSVDSLIDQAYKEKTFNEQVRHNKATEGAQWAQINAARDAQRQKQFQLSPRDENILNKTTEQSDAAAKAVASMANVLPYFKAAGEHLGPGFEAKRNIAGVLSVIPGYTALEKQLSNDGQSQTENTITNFDNINAASKKLGAELLAMFGGSDTQLELLTAIETTISPNKNKQTNERIFRDQLAAANILSNKADLMTRWANNFGGVNALSPTGESWTSFWAKYQRAAWADWRKQSVSFDGNGQPTSAPTGPRDYRQEQRDLLSGKTKQGIPAPPPGFEVVR